MNDFKVSFTTRLEVDLPDDLCINLFHCAVDHLVLTSDVIAAALEYAFCGKMSFEEYLKVYQADFSYFTNKCIKSDV